MRCFKVFICGFVTVLFLGCTEQYNTAKPPKGVISIEEAKILDRTFTETRADAINKAIGMPDSRSSWWSVDDLEAYIAYAKRVAKEKGYNVNGLRVYYGAYPKDYHNAEVSGYSTLFIVPTGNKAASNEAAVFSINFQEEEEDLEVPPLNMGHLRKPPPGTYQ